MNLVQFKATAKEVESLEAVFPGMGNYPGITYCNDGCCIETTEDGYCLTIGSCSWASSDLDPLERRLFVWYRGEHPELFEKPDLKRVFQYLEFFRDNPAAHPDDAWDYSAEQLELVSDVAEIPGIPDQVHYPTFLQCWAQASKMLHSFHSDDEDRTFLDAIWRIDYFMNCMTTYDLRYAAEAIDGLVQFHDGAPEEIFECLVDVSEALHWLLEYAPNAGEKGGSTRQLTLELSQKELEVIIEALDHESEQENFEPELVQSIIKKFEAFKK